MNDETKDPITRRAATGPLFDPDAIAPYDETVRLVLDVDRRPYSDGDHWSQVIERLQTAADREYQAFEHDGELWIQRTPDIDAPLIVSGAPGARTFCLMTAPTEYVLEDGRWTELV